MSDLLNDVPLLTHRQFTALQMAVSMSGNDYLIAETPDYRVNRSEWSPIAQDLGGLVIYLSIPREREEHPDDCEDWSMARKEEEGYNYGY